MNDNEAMELPVGWLKSQLDATDIVVLSVALLLALFYLWKNRSSASKDNFVPTITRSSELSNCCIRQQTSIIDRMKHEGRKVLIIYGSQTGTAEELAGRLAKDVQNYGQKVMLIDPEEMDIEDFGRIAEINDILLILCMATYGEGDPTDNSQELYQYLADADINLKGINFSVFGLGNKTYEHFNEMGKFFDRRIEELGATRLYELGLGDDDGNLEEDFMRWREGFWPTVANIYSWEVAETGSQRQYRFDTALDPSTKLFIGEYGRKGAFEKQRPPFDQKNPFLAEVDINRELHTEKSERSCRHIEFKINGARLRYETGDHLGVFPANDLDRVSELGKLLSVDIDLPFNLINLDEESMKKNPFPCPCTIRTALTYYVDICAPVKSHVLRALAAYTVDEEEKERLLLLSTANEIGLKEYGTYIQKERRSIIDILRSFPSCKPPVDHLLELLPRLQARYYSISSSPKADNDIIDITVIITKYTIGDRLIKGVCTNYLHQKKKGDKVPIFVRKSTMRLPHRLTTPVIMIGPGTGFAPFRGFLQERAWHKAQGKQIGNISLYYGCRRPDHDYIYADELKKYIADGVLSELHVAFSRATENKVYVQHKLWDNRETVWRAIEEGAHIYVCGDARNMARDVQSTFVKIFVEVGKKSELEAQKYQRELEKHRRYQADVWS